jgi:hypothetical protein
MSEIHLTTNVSSSDLNKIIAKLVKLSSNGPTGTLSSVASNPDYLLDLERKSRFGCGVSARTFLSILREEEKRWYFGDT